LLVLGRLSCGRQYRSLYVALPLAEHAKQDAVNAAEGKTKNFGSPGIKPEQEHHPGGDAPACGEGTYDGRIGPMFPREVRVTTKHRDGDPAAEE